MSSETHMQQPWYRSTLGIALVGSLLLWAALPPLALGWLGWIAPVPWLLLVRADMLPGRRSYRALWLAGFVFWLCTLHWLRLPHPAVYLGWLALSAYLAIYLPVFVALSRVAVHRVGVPLWIAAPVVWTGLELARAHLLTGFLMASLAHTQVKWTAMIQISDIFGEYGVDFVVMLVASCIASVLRIEDLRSRIDVPSARSTWQPLAIIPAIIVLSAVLLYGHSRLSEFQSRSDEVRRPIRIALIQGNSLADWKMDTSKQRQIMQEYIGLSKQAVEKAKSLNDGRSIDLIVWPETMYRNPLREFEDGYQSPREVEATPEEVVASDKRMLADLVAYLGAPVLVGIDRVRFLASDSADATGPNWEAYNSAALVDASGQVVGTYDKFHLVMFGEYVPFARRLPFLNRLSSITGSVLAGEGPVALCTGGICYSPNICYETVIPHVIRRHVKSADVLVNMTNDAWYWGSSELDQHLACGVFRAVETRKPLVIAANGGLSAWIDHFGKVREQSPRQRPYIILADVERSNMRSWYMRFGDWFAGLCLTACVALAIIEIKTRRHGDKETRSGEGDT
jgi:apolipoprotein N-acyltransferase